MRAWVFAGVASVALLTGVAAAHGHGGLRRADANGDGVLTRQEFDAGRDAMFARKDADNNGALSQDEMRAHREGMRGGHHGGRHHGHHERGGHGERLAAADANADGAITREEFMARPSQMFDRLDTDHNGIISQAERDAMRAQHREGAARWEHVNPDANADGIVSREEYVAAGAAVFTRLDANGDGQVTREEAPARRRGHRS